MEIPTADLQNLKYAKDLLERPSLAARLTNVLGAPIEKGLELLPPKWSEIVHEATRKSLSKGLDFAIMTMDERPKPISFNVMHKAMVAASGAAGGAFGLLGLSIELPVSTVIMLRSVADVARSEGENIRMVETRLACLEVFALGGRNVSDDASETGYFAVRAALAGAVSEATAYIMQRGLAEEGAPALVRLIAAIASRFGTVVSEKVAAQAIPVIGATGGAVINTIFIDHFQDMARGHFIVRRLERAYGNDEVRHLYDSL